MDVVWKDIPRCGGIYQASNHGEIRSIDRFIFTNRLVPRRGVVLRPKVKKNGGHLAVLVLLDGKRSLVHVARLVLAAFYGWPTEKLEACHGDSNPKNNKLENLRWDTKSGNHKDRIAAGTSIRGSAHFATNLTDKDVLDARALLSSGHKVAGVAKMFNVGPSAMRNIKLRITWKHI